MKAAPLQALAVPLFNDKPPRKIALFRALQLGDMLCTVPAMRALRAAAPQAQITLIGLPWAASFVKRFSRYLDSLLVFPGFPGFPEQPLNLTAVPHFLAEAQRQRFDLVLQMHGSGRLSNPLAMLCGAERTAGFYQPGEYCPNPQTFMPWEDHAHEVLRGVRLMEYLGIEPQGEHLEFPLSDADYRALQRSHLSLPAPGSYVCIHPGARLPSRRWQPRRFAEVADRLATDGIKIVLTGAPDEAELVRAVQREMRMPALNLCGKTDLGSLAALIAQARLVVCNDTGISHVAAAVATPSVIVSCGSDPQRWAPLDRMRHRMISADVACRPCMYHNCPTAHECAEQVGVDTVAAMATRLLNTASGTHA
ncbi:MAG TPA: glycosyltransferase family 9 protein [Noviherbaspirillum sp.]|nr:glycosyltransferase family 9 protein [Noviherbaspirillum sp.]